ncbi:hypothetical protein [Novosphingobium rosa]|uniref:hypothetical protein n=1 Tax=Novosphingobium rosa TaxID=76978 RepID=UPI00082FC27F|nr:hypothetical protein [Novosphingobium rosa]
MVFLLMPGFALGVMRFGGGARGQIVRPGRADHLILHLAVVRALILRFFLFAMAMSGGHDRAFPQKGASRGATYHRKRESQIRGFR